MFPLTFAFLAIVIKISLLKNCLALHALSTLCEGAIVLALTTPGIGNHTLQDGDGAERHPCALSFRERAALGYRVDAAEGVTDMDWV